MLFCVVLLAVSVCPTLSITSSPDSEQLCDGVLQIEVPEEQEPKS